MKKKVSKTKKKTKFRKDNSLSSNELSNSTENSVEKISVSSTESSDHTENSDERTSPQNIKNISEIILRPFRLEKVGPFWILIPEIVFPTSPCFPQQDSHRKQLPSVLQEKTEEVSKPKVDTVNKEDCVTERKSVINDIQEAGKYNEKNRHVDGMENINTNFRILEFSTLGPADEVITALSMIFSVAEDFVLKNPADEDGISAEMWNLEHCLQLHAGLEYLDCYMYLDFVIFEMANSYKIFLESRTKILPKVLAERFYQEMNAAVLIHKSELKHNLFEDLDSTHQFVLTFYKKILFNYTELLREQVYRYTGVIGPNIFEKCIENGVLRGDMKDFVEITNSAYVKLRNKPIKKVLKYIEIMKINNDVCVEADVEKEEESLLSFYQELWMYLTSALNDQKYFYDGCYFEENIKSWQNFQQVYLNCI